MRIVASLIASVMLAVVLGAQPARAVESDAYQVLAHAAVLIDAPNCAGDPSQIALLPARCFEPAHQLHPTGRSNVFRPATHVYRFGFPPGDEPATHWVLNVSTYVTRGELDLVTADGRVLQSLTFGSDVPVADRPIYAHELELPIAAPHPSGAELVLRMTAPFEQPTILEMRTRAQQAALDHDQVGGEALPLAFLNGFAMAMALFNLMLFVMLRRKLYLLYAATILALVLYQLVETGAAWTVVWPHLGLRDDWPPYATWVLYFGLIVAFSRDFLQLQRVSAIADRVLLSVFALLCFESAVYVIEPDWLTILGIFDITDPLMTAVMLGTMLGVGVVAWRRGVTAAPYYVLAFAGSAAGFVISDAGTYDLYPSSVTAAYIATSIGGAWESIFLALALGRRVREIEHSAQIYAEYAYVDPLTGIANRRGFDEAIEREFRRTLRQPGPISVIIFDIDRFKEYNDRFGHPAGDVRLVSVANQIAEAARRTGDLAARYGGEEFAMLLPGTPLEGAFAIADAIRLAIRESPGVEYRLTVSAGCATAFPHSDALDSANPLTLLKEADAALYVAKTTGRDRVCIPEDGIV